MRALIAGTDRSSYLALDSCKITRDINGKATLTCVLLGTGGYRPSLGNEIIIDDGASPATKYFAGNISRGRGNRSLHDRYACRGHLPQG
jgi:hypothetical protein